MIALWFALAAAKAPDEVRPTLAPIDAPRQFEEYLAAAGRSGEALACDPLWPEQALLCFKVLEGKKLRWVTTKDLAKWKVDVAALRARATDRAREVLATQPKPVSVEGMSGRYWAFAEGDGWAAAGALQPALLAERVGSPQVLVAAPTADVLLAWAPGNPQLDHVLAVGAKEMYEQQDHPVTPVVYLWSNGVWTEFAEAKPVAPGAPR